MALTAQGSRTAHPSPCRAALLSALPRASPPARCVRGCSGAATRCATNSLQRAWSRPPAAPGRLGGLHGCCRGPCTCRSLRRSRSHSRLAAVISAGVRAAAEKLMTRCVYSFCILAGIALRVNYPSVVLKVHGTIWPYLLTILLQDRACLASALMIDGTAQDSLASTACL